MNKKKSIFQRGGNQANQFGEVHGDVNMTIQHKGGLLAWLSSGCLSFSALMVGGTALILVGIVILVGYTIFTALSSSTPPQTALQSQLTSVSGQGGQQQANRDLISGVGPTLAASQLPTPAPSGIEGYWLALFYDQAWGYTNYQVQLTRSGNLIGGQSTIWVPAYPDCYMTFLITGEVTDETDGIAIHFQEDYTPIACQIYGSAGSTKEMDLVYSNATGVEILKGNWRDRAGLYYGAAEFTRPVP